MPKTYQEIDRLVRKEMPDTPGRRRILQALHEIEEGQNLCLNYALGACGYQMQPDGSFKKEESTPFQVHARISGVS